MLFFRKYKQKYNIAQIVFRKEIWKQAKNMLHLRQTKVNYAQTTHSQRHSEYAH
jgi:hypothetical protein